MNYVDRFNKNGIEYLIKDSRINIYTIDYPNMGQQNFEDIIQGDYQLLHIININDRNLEQYFRLAYATNEENERKKVYVLIEDDTLIEFIIEKEGSDPASYEVEEIDLRSGGSGDINDVRVNGVSVVNDRIANIIMSAVGESGDYNDLINKPTLGTAAFHNIGTSLGEIPTLNINGKLASSVLPALAITNTFIASTQEEMLALSAEIGDVCVRTDINKSFILKEEPTSTLSSWQELLTPTDAVQSVNGQTGNVVLATSNLTNDSGYITTNDLTNYVTTDTAQLITAPKSFYNTNVKNTLPLRIQGFHNHVWGLEMDKDFGELRFKYADANGTNISNVSDQLVLNLSALYPAVNGGKDLGTSSYTWKDLYLSGNATFTSGQKVSKIYENANGLNFMTDNNTNLLIGSANIYAYKNILPSGTIDLGSSSYTWNDLYLSGSIKDNQGNAVTVEQLYFLGKSIQGLAQPNVVNLSDGDTLTDQPTIYMMSQHLPVMINSGMCYFLTEDTNYYVYTTHYFDSSNLDVVPYKVIVDKSTFVVTIDRI